MTNIPEKPADFALVNKKVPTNAPILLTGSSPLPRLAVQHLDGNPDKWRRYRGSTRLDVLKEPRRNPSPSLARHGQPHQLLIATS